MTKDGRPHVGEATVKSMGRGRSQINQGTSDVNPHHTAASKLESRKWSSPAVSNKDVILVPGGPARANVATAYSRKESWSRHMGTSGASHGFRGVNYGRKK